MKHTHRELTNDHDEINAQDKVSPITVTPGLCLIFSIVYIILLAVTYYLTPAAKTIILLPLMLFLPGALTLTAIDGKIQSWSLYKTSYAIGLSITELFLLGLSLNPFMHSMTNHEQMLRWPYFLGGATALELIPALVLGLRAFRQKIVIQLPRPRFNKIPVGHLLLSLMLPLLTIFGANELNNGGSDFIALLVPICVLVLLITLYFRHPAAPGWIIPLLLLVSGCCLLLQYSLRSNYLFGSDIHEEFMVFQLAITRGHWALGNSSSPYNACLSITILPITLKYLLGLSPYTIFKVILPIIISTMVLPFYALCKKFIGTRLAVLAGIFFISSPAFSEILIMHLRTGIAFIFFSLALLIYFDKKVARASRNALFLLFSLTVIVSHYSTAYIFVAIIITWKVLDLLLGKLQRSRAIDGANLRWGTVAIIVLGALLWLAQISHVSGGFRQFLLDSAQNYSTIFTQSSTSNQANLLNQINFKSDQDAQQQLNKYTSDQFSKKVISTNTALLVLPTPFANYKFSPGFDRLVYETVGLMAKLLKLAFILAPFFFLYKYLRNKGHIFDVDFLSLSFACLATLFLITVIPGASIFYSINRLYQMVAAVLTLPMILFLYRTVSKMKLGSLILSVPFCAYFAAYSGMLPTILGGQPNYASLTNASADYEEYYENRSEFQLAAWLAAKYPTARIVSDETMYRELQEKGVFTNLDTANLVPELNSEDRSFIVEGTTNLNSIGYTNVDGNIVRYTFPDFNNSKNLIYSSGKAVVYR